MEPRFELRAQDIFAPYSVRHYAEMLRAYAAGLERAVSDDENRDLRLSINSIREKALSAERVAAAMVAWQAANPDAVKVPD